MYKKIIVMLVLAAVGAVLLLAGCRVQVHSGTSNLSDWFYDDAEKYTAGGAELSETVEHIEISWLAGNVTLKSHDSDTVAFSEKSADQLSDDTQLHYWLDGTTLRIKFCGSGQWVLDGLEKELTVLVPETLELTNLKVNSVSAGVDLDSIRAESAAISTTSGNICLTDCAVTELAKISTVSGGTEAKFAQPLEDFACNSTSGEIQVAAPAVMRFEADTVSGPVSFSAQSAPESLDIDTTSGCIDLALPEDASFTLDCYSTSGTLSSDLPHRTENGQYIFGDGKGEYTVNTISGDVRITAEK